MKVGTKSRTELKNETKQTDRHNLKIRVGNDRKSERQPHPSLGLSKKETDFRFCMKHYLIIISFRRLVKMNFYKHHLSISDGKRMYIHSF